MNSEKTGKFISELRKEKELTQLQRAELLHVSDKAISRWETGKGFPDIGSLEAVADVLKVSVAELLRGEHFPEELSREEAETYTSDLFVLLKKSLYQKKIKSLVLGFLISAVFLTALIVHLNAPVYIKDAGNALEMEELSDGRIVAVLKEDVAGYRIDDVRDLDDGKICRTISCYRTLLHPLSGKKTQTVVILNGNGDPDYIFYYPGETGDQLLYAKNGSPDFGVETLPRLIYNYWIILGTLASIGSLLLFYLSRKKYYAGRIWKAALIPLSFTISTLLVLAGRFTQVYNAAYYFSGILLLGFLLYLLLLYALNPFRKKA